MGGIGNNLFQISATIAFSLKYKIDYCIPKAISNPHYRGQQVFQSSYLNYCDFGISTVTIYKEPSFEYREIPPPQSNFTLLQGYFQSYKFFDDYREEILEILDIPVGVPQPYVAIHWRLGDYRTLSNCHPPVSKEYIQKGIEYFIKSGYTNFMVFSDEIDFAYENIVVPENCSLIFSEGRTEIEDLALAASCEHILGSNSSFSWWAYYLNQNENKIGVFPQKDKWFGEALKYNKVDDLYLPEWVLL